MKRKPDSIIDLIKTVQCCTHPELDNNEQVILVKLAVCASKAGTGSRPTYAYLGAGSGWGSTHVGNLLRSLKQKGLIECTHRGRGERNASIFRICIDHDAFPDDYPTLKLTATDECHKPKRLTATGTAVMRHSKAGLPPLVDGYAPLISVNHPNPHPNKQPQPQHQTTGSQVADSNTVVAVVVAEKTVSDVVRILSDKYIKQEKHEPVGVTKRQEEALRRLAQTHGDEKFLGACNVWLNRKPWDGNTTATFAYLIKRFDDYIQVANLKVERRDEAGDIERSTNAATVSHINEWSGQQILDQATHEELTRYNQIRNKRFDATADDVAFVRDLAHRCDMAAKAERQAEPVTPTGDSEESK